MSKSYYLYQTYDYFKSPNFYTTRFNLIQKNKNVENIDFDKLIGEGVYHLVRAKSATCAKICIYREYLNVDVGEDCGEYIKTVME